MLQFDYKSKLYRCCYFHNFFLIIIVVVVNRLYFHIATLYVHGCVCVCLCFHLLRWPCCPFVVSQLFFSSCAQLLYTHTYSYSHIDTYRYMYHCLFVPAQQFKVLWLLQVFWCNSSKYLCFYFYEQFGSCMKTSFLLLLFVYLLRRYIFFFGIYICIAIGIYIYICK